MKMIRDTSGLVANWVSAKIGAELEAENAFGFIHKGKLVAALAIEAESPDSIEVSIASDDPRWCTRKNLSEMFKVTFDDLNYHYIFTKTPSRNSKAVKLAEGLGFKRDGMIREGHERGEDDLIIFGMLRKDCEYVN